MANCCNDYTSCQALASIEYMKELVSATPLSDSCIEIQTPSSVSSCCDDVESIHYVPTYSELSGSTYAPLRSLNDSNPTEDVNGFIFTEPTLDNNDGCCEISLGEKSLTKSEVSFGYTSAITNTMEITTPPSACNLNYVVTETRGYERHTLTCDENDNISDSVSTTSITIEHKGELDRNVNQVDRTNNYEISFIPRTESGETISQCGDSVSSITAVTLESYTVGFSFDGINVEVPCEGGTYTAATISALTCDEDMSLVVTLDIGDGNDRTYEVSGSTENDVDVEIQIDRNDNGYTSGHISITPIVWGKSGKTVSDTFIRQTCAWSPIISKSSNCCPLVYEEDWEKEGQQIIHPYE